MISLKLKRRKSIKALFQHIHWKSFQKNEVSYLTCMPKSQKLGNQMILFFTSMIFEECPVFIMRHLLAKVWGNSSISSEFRTSRHLNYTIWTLFKIPWHSYSRSHPLKWDSWKFNDRRKRDLKSLITVICSCFSPHNVTARLWDISIFNNLNGFRSWSPY